MPSSMNEDPSSLNIECRFGGPIEPGFVAVILHNCPITPISNGDSLAPAFKISAEQAMEVGMTLIHMAKLSQAQHSGPLPMAASEAERCTQLTPYGQCCLRRDHDGRHAVVEG